MAGNAKTSHKRAKVSTALPQGGPVTPACLLYGLGDCCRALHVFLWFSHTAKAVDPLHGVLLHQKVWLEQKLSCGRRAVPNWQVSVVSCRCSPRPGTWVAQSVAR